VKPLGLATPGIGAIGRSFQVPRIPSPLTHVGGAESPVLRCSLPGPWRRASIRPGWASMADATLARRAFWLILAHSLRCGVKRRIVPYGSSERDSRCARTARWLLLCVACAKQVGRCTRLLGDSRLAYGKAVCGADVFPPWRCPNHVC
jgi:hypothetical protein